MEKLRLIEDRRVFGGRSYSSQKLKSKPLTWVSSSIEKVLITAYCIKCGASGMAYQDPQGTISKPHYCIKHNPKIDNNRRSEPMQKICKEETCRKAFTNNGRNSHNDKEFCCSSCSSKYSNRIYRQQRELAKTA